MISGFDGRGLLNFGSAGHAAVRQRVTDRRAEVEVPAVLALAPLREAGRERAGQRLDRALELLHLLARRVHEVDVLGQRLAQRARHRLDPAIGDEPAPDLRLDHVAQLAQAASYSSRAKRACEIALVALALALALALLLRPLHQPRGEAVVVELPQRPVQVVGAADRPPGLHPGEARRPPSPRSGAAGPGPCS